jgi:glycosyltransferase involved in cell wall biosynthesis
MINSDLTSNGGIASVIKSLYLANEKKMKIDLYLLKTTYYKDKKLHHKIFLFIKSLILFVAYLVFNKIDIIHIHSSAGISFYRKFIFFILGRIFRKPIIFHIHASKFNEFYLCHKKSINYLFIKYLLYRSQVVLTLCAAWKLELLKHYGNIKVESLANPIAVSSYGGKDKNGNGRSLKVLFLGFLIESKGIFDLLKTAKALKDKNIRSIKFYVAGKGELQSSLISRISMLGLGDMVEFIGWADDKIKKRLLDEADIFFLPSYNEGMPISILEAMSSKCAIISTNIAGIPELVKDGVNGYLFDPGDTESYCNCFSSLINDREKVCLMGNQSFRFAEDYDSVKVLDRLINIYDKLI